MIREFPELIENGGGKPLLILHAGINKTGTSSLQNYFYHNHDLLAREGVLYPLTAIYSQTHPKHQWIVNDLLDNRWSDFHSKLKATLESSIHPIREKIRVTVLSTEGIYNHWWDFSDEAKENFRAVGELFNLKVMIFFRNPISYAWSLYKQAIYNSKSDLVECYGSPYSFEEMLRDKWFIRRLNYIDFIDDAEKYFGPGSISPFRYEDGNTINMVRGFLKIKDTSDHSKYTANISIGDAGVEFLRVLNRFDMTREEREKCRDLIRAIDVMASRKADASPIIEKNRRTILALTGKSLEELRRRYGIEWPDL